MARTFLHVAAALLCACASRQPAAPGGATPESNTIAADVAATAASWVGRSRTDVIAALGPATVLRFDSGYEVWVYRFVDPSQRQRADARSAPSAALEEGAPRSEVVLLFTPANVVAKVRVRSPPPNVISLR